MNRLLLIAACCWLSAAQAQQDTTGWHTLNGHLNAHLDLFMRRDLPQYAATVERTTEEWGHETLTVQTTELAMLLLSESTLADTMAERLYDFLDSAAAHFFREGTAVQLFSGLRPVPPPAYVLSSAGDTIRLAPSPFGCVRAHRQSLAEDVFNLRTKLLLDRKHRPENEKRMIDFRAGIRKASAKAARKRRKAS